MHIIKFTPDIDHPLDQLLKDARTAYSKANGMFDFGIAKRKQEKAKSEKDVEVKKQEAIAKFREYFPMYKDNEIKIVYNQGHPRIGWIFEIKIPYVETKEI